MYGFRAALILRALPDRRPNNAPRGSPESSVIRASKIAKGASPTSLISSSPRPDPQVRPVEAGGLPVRPVPRAKTGRTSHLVRETAGQAPFSAGSRIATHSACEVIEKMSQGARRQKPQAETCFSAQWPTCRGPERQMSVTVETASASLQRDSDLRRRETWLTKARHDVAAQGEAAQGRRWRGRVRGRCGRGEGPAAAPGQPSSSCASRLPLRHAARPRGALRAHVQRRIQPTDQPDHHRLGSLSHRARDVAGPGVRVALSAPGSAGSRPAERLHVIAAAGRMRGTGRAGPGWLLLRQRQLRTSDGRCGRFARDRRHRG